MQALLRVPSAITTINITQRIRNAFNAAAILTRDLHSTRSVNELPPRSVEEWRKMHLFGMSEGPRRNEEVLKASTETETARSSAGEGNKTKIIDEADNKPA